MSYDLTIFEPNKAPQKRQAFYSWFESITEWDTEDDCDDPAVCSQNLNAWFMEAIQTFPALNGPHALEDRDEFEGSVVDYSIAPGLIYAAFPWEVAEEAYELVFNLCIKHQVGFYDTSATDGAIYFPNENGQLQRIDEFGEKSSITEIKGWAKTGEEHLTIKDLVFNQAFGGSSTKKWWQFWK